MDLKMKDIAKLANVSLTTVSLVLNGKPGVSHSTRERVMQVIDHYKYKPLRQSRSEQAQQLAKINLLVINQTGGMVHDNYRALPFFDNLVTSMSQAVKKLGGNFQIDTIAQDELSNTLHKLAHDKKLEATIVLGTDLTQREVKYIHQELKHVVFVDTYYPDVSADFVTMDNYQGAQTAANKIISAGYSKIGYAASNRWISNFQERRRGFYNALHAQRLDIDPEYFYLVSPTALNPNTKETVEINKENLPEVIFCEDDYIAIRLIKELLKQKIEVPKDVGIVGFDDIYADTLIIPEVTTIHVPVKQIVNQAIYQLRSQVSDDSWQPQKTLVTTKFISRSSLIFPKEEQTL